MATKLTTAEFINKANLLHDNLYTYNNTIYVNSHTKVAVTCTKHGDFYLKPNNHLSGKQGCPKCAILKTTSKKVMDIKEFKARISVIYKGTMDTSNVTYVNNRTPVTVTHNCGHTYSTTPNTLLKGSTCPKCAIDNLQKTNLDKQNKTKQAISKLQDYEVLGNYVSAKVPIEVKHVCGTTFSVTPDNLLRKHPCPGCANFGFNPFKPAILYYLSINNGKVYKIGITNRTVEERFKAIQADITVIHTWKFKLGAKAYSKEQEILKLFKEYRISDSTIISSGFTELFNTDIFTLGILDENYFTQ